MGWVLWVNNEPIFSVDGISFEANGQIALHVADHTPAIVTATGSVVVAIFQEPWVPVEREPLRSVGGDEPSTVDEP